MSQEELRYGFGKNWAEFIEKNLSEKIVEDSIEHMKRFMKRDNLNGLRILDIGCGSGIHSLAMKRLGASEVVAFDYDVNSVETSKKVREWSGLTDGWCIEQGSVLDKAYMESLGKFDIVYSWGVLHHTGAMWEAVRNAAIPLAEESEFYIALYSSDTYVDPTPEEWVKIKKTYNFASPLKKKLMEIDHVYNHVVKPQRTAGKGALAALRDYGLRGMDVWSDAKDWLGGYPMEFAGLHETCDFVAKEAGLEMVNVINGEGCTEYLFANPSKNAHWASVNNNRQMFTLNGPFQHLTGYGFMAHLPEHENESDDVGYNMRSTLMLFEQGRPMGISHSLHEVIKNRGGGRFAHWQKWLVFSAIDNTDPNTNASSYTFCLNY